MVEPVSRKTDEFATVIGPVASFKGELTFQGSVRVDGTFEGAVRTSGHVLVSKGGTLKAEVQAGSIALEGHLEGNVAAEDRIELRATGQMIGDIRASKLLVMEGATFVGRCEVGPGVKGQGTKAGPPAVAERPAISVAGVGKK
jgi:cytoskeletal protein CcmA (bactofilin family)